MDENTYEPVRDLPAPDDYPLRWMGVEVPGDLRRRPELRMAHRVFLRTRVEVPSELAGRGFHLHFSGTCWIASVLVNGRFVEGRQSVLVPWDCDVTGHVKPGATNEIVVGIKSPWYAMDPQGRGTSIDDLRNVPVSHLRWSQFVDAIYPSSKGEGQGHQTGIINPVKLIVTGPAYASDVFVRTRVAGKRLDADVTIANPTADAANLSVTCEAMHEKTGKVEKMFGPVEAAVPAEASRTVSLGGAWPDAELWWPEADPDLYVLRTTLRRDGKPIDVHEQPFGFREVGIDGKHFLLNGVRWHFWNWVDVGDVGTEAEWLEKYHAQNDRFHRIASDHDRLFGYREKALDFFDRHGIPGRLSTCIDGMFITHDVNNPLVWKNFAHHVRQVVKAYRNHPSIMMWSLGNELMFVTCRLRYHARYRELEEKAAELSRIAQDLDPTRASFQDGGGDLGALIAMNCQHYSWETGQGFPACAYQYRILDDGPIMPRPRDPAELYMWDGKKPLVLGEVFYYSGNVSKMAWVGGPDVFRGRSFADQAAARYARIAIEGARWQDVTAICPWVRGLPGTEVSFAPRAVFVREHNTCFAARSTMKRTLGIFNDGRNGDPLSLEWWLVLDGKEVDHGRTPRYHVPPGRHENVPLEIKMPPTSKRKDGELRLELSSGEEVVFQDTKPVSVLPPTAGPIPGLDGDSLAVIDFEDGSVIRWLRKLGQPFTDLHWSDPVPAAVNVVVVGRGAISPHNKKVLAPALREAVLAGKTVLVLEQTEPLERYDLPLAGIEIAGLAEQDRQRREEFREAGGRSGSISFPVAPAHPVLDGLKPRDFFTWADDEFTPGVDDANFRLSYATPATGAIALVQAGNELGLAPMIEVPVGEGSYLLSQMLIAEKLYAEPVADRLLGNMLAWAAARSAAEPGRTIAYLAGDDTLDGFLAKTGLLCETAPQVEAALEGDVAIVRANADALARLADHKQAVTDFCDSGGWLMLVGLDEKGLDAFNRLVGFPHRIRPFRREAVVLHHRDDPLLLGLSDRDVNMQSDQVLAAWKHLYWISDRVFSAVVDGKEIASFGGTGEPVVKVTNGMTNEDFWQYIYYLDAEGSSITFDFGRPETITAIRVKPTAAPYYYLKDVEIRFDGDAKPVPFTCQRGEGLQDVPLEPRTASKVTIAVKSHYPGDSTKDLVGIDLVEIDRRLPPESDGKPALLTKPGGLVKYPIGQGGILLNQLDYLRPDAVENVRKKRIIYANLLRNMGAAFAVAGTD
jgi:beta-galactosidase